MATLMPAYSSCASRMTPGERRLAQRLESKLEKDYLLWYDVSVGRKRLHPDFILLHPLRGLIVLEVKDWSLENIEQVTHDTFTIKIPEGTKSFKNPLEQARDYTLAIVNQLESDSQLVQPSGPFQGKLIFPYSFGVVLPNIKRKALDQAYFLEPMFAEVLPPNLVICQDEMVPSVDTLEFQTRLWDLCTYQFGESLTLSQIDRIRWHIFPEIRIGEVFNQQIRKDEVVDDIPDVIRIMDLQQEQLARSLGDGHRVIHGVAGSGKTMILAYRCIHLAKETTKPILVLCYNVALAAMLRQKLNAEGISHRVAVHNIHKWCNDLLWQYRIPKPSQNQYQGASYWDELVKRVLEAVSRDKIPKGQYGAVLIDEGHDFKPEWYQLVVKMVDPDTDSLLVLYDDAQSIYDKKQRRQFSFKSVGVQAQGRTKILKINYRNTEEILGVAYEFAKELLTPMGIKNDDDIPILIKPETAGRRGPAPELIRLPSFQHEVDYLIEVVKTLNSQGKSWNDIGILYRSKFMAEEITKSFHFKGIPIEWVTRDRKSRNFDLNENSIKLVTLHSSKGLEFPVVCIAGLGFMPRENQDSSNEARLLYVAMTRAMDQLILTGHRQSTFLRQIDEILKSGM